MKKMLKILVVVFLVAVLASQSLAFWGRGEKANKLDPGKKMEMITQKLDLSKEQQAALKANEEKRKEARKVHRAEMKKLAEQLKVEIDQDTPDRTKLHALIGKINQQRVEMEIQRLDALLELRALLTPIQREKYKKLMNQHKPRGPKGR
ncbi:MAG: periplasmic heavy metal sensor [Candidatus Margulisbacteria bacterium]|nr:periplasmic heavy metal sensor [Candidatus Margulisiibacteriota bacterium]